MRGISFDLPEKLYLKDPQNSKFGQKLLSDSILLIDEIGIEAFTFKKIASKMGSAEASVYRYFENKHMLLLYLISWYWEWVHYLIDIHITNISDPKLKLEKAIHQIVNASSDAFAVEYINQNILHQVVVKEGTKAYHIVNVDEENKHGFYFGYKSLVAKVSELISQVNAAFPYPHILASNLFEMANNQIYFAEHIPKLTDIKNRKRKYQDLETALNFFVEKILA